MNRTGMTVSPVYSDETGEMLDVELSPTRRGYVGADEFYAETEQGFEHIETNDPEQINSAWVDYIDTYEEAFPELTAAIEQAKQDPSLTPFVEKIMEAAQSQDMDAFNEAAEALLESYETEASELENWYDGLDPEYIESEVETLSNTEFTTDQAEQFVEIAQNFATDTVEHAICKAGVDLAFGKASFDQVLEQLTDTYGDAAVAHAYQIIKDNYQ